MTLDIWAALFISAIISATPLIIVGLGEIISEKAGVLNLGLEGLMLMGAVMAFITATNTKSLMLAVLVALGVGLLLGALYAFFTVTLRANQIVSGLALVFFGTGLSGFVGKSVSGTAISVSFKKIAIPYLSDIPFFGDILFHHDLLVYVTYLLVVVISFYIYKTRAGLKLRALGENPGALDAVGINVNMLRYLYVMIGCSLAALGGAYLTLAYTPSWTDGMTAGKGWIALALVIFASWKPWRCVLGAVLFGAIDVLSFQLQAIGFQVPTQLVCILPYLFTVVVLIFTTIRSMDKISEEPAALTRSYYREDR